MCIIFHLHIVHILNFKNHNENNNIRVTRFAIICETQSYYFTISYNYVASLTYAISFFFLHTISFKKILKLIFFFYHITSVHTVFFFFLSPTHIHLFLKINRIIIILPISGKPKIIIHFFNNPSLISFTEMLSLVLVTSFKINFPYYLLFLAGFLIFSIWNFY